MKETYVKPQLHVEYFTLSQSIAKSCGYVDESYIGAPTHSEPGVDGCGWRTNNDDSSSIVIWSDGCNIPGNDNTQVDDGCYNAPSIAGAIFAS